MHFKPASVIHNGLIPIFNLASVLFKGVSLIVLGMRSLRKTSYSGAVIISVDNLSFGGTGKTTLVRQIGHMLMRRGLKFAIVSRGYRSECEDAGARVSSASRVREVGDEALLLKKQLPSGDVYIGKNRRASIQKALENNCRIIILDDGFQSTGIHKNLKIMLINPRHPYYYLRNFKWLSRREDVVLSLTGESDFNRSSGSGFPEPAQKKPGLPLQGHYRFSEPEFFTSRGLEAGLKSSGLLGFSALGDNPRFQADLSRLNLKRFESFPDHHAFTQADLNRLDSIRKKNRLDYLVCTEKDFVKLSELNISGIPLIYAKNSIKLSINLDELILRHVRQENFI
jgi:tetraacyldisaccharide 4'-kinase